MAEEEPASSLISSYKGINPIYEGLRGWKSQREEGRRREREKEREQKIFSKSLYRERERNRVVFQGGYGR